MRNTRFLVAAALAASLTLVATASAKPGNGHGGGKGRPGRGAAALVNPGVDVDAKGKVDVKFFPAVGHRVERSWLRVKLMKLDANAPYTMWMDDPTTAAPDTTVFHVADVTTNDDGHAKVQWDTKKGDVLPFASTLGTLAGMTFEVRTGTVGTVGAQVVLTGSVPVLR